MLRRAVALARRGEGRVEPNPMVGCLIARGDRIIAEGHHRRFGGSHAEVDALRRAESHVRGATMYVSLEPCCHQGKTPPCTGAIIEAGIARVVVAASDPHPLVRGGGIRTLRRAGVVVDILKNEAAAADVLAPYLTGIHRRRPYVIAKWAQSLDGKLATRRGESKWISCTASRRRVHRLRARVDAILVGVGTVIADDPLLTARDVPLRRTALRVVLDGHLRTPPRSRIVRTAGTVPTVICTERAAARGAKAERLRSAGVEVVGCAMRSGRIVLPDLLRSLCEHDVTNLMVEGGPAVLGAFLRDGLVDEAWAFVAPILIGGVDAPGVITDIGPTDLARMLRPLLATAQRSGVDTFHRLQFTDPAALLKRGAGDRRGESR